MEVTYAPEFKPGTEEYELLERASAVLGDLPPVRSSEALRAEWRPAADTQGRKVYRLSLNDHRDQVSTDFKSTELRYPLSMRVGLSGLWGDLLKARHDRQHELVQSLISDFESEGEDR